jgi:hypothetical protein
MQPRGAVGIDCARKGWPPIHVRRSCGGHVLQSYATAIAIQKTLQKSGSRGKASRGFKALSDVDEEKLVSKFM